MLRPAHRQAIGVEDEHKDAQTQHGLVRPIRYRGLKEGKGEEEGGNKKDVKESQYLVMVEHPT